MAFAPDINSRTTPALNWAVNFRRAAANAGIPLSLDGHLPVTEPPALAPVVSTGCDRALLLAMDKCVPPSGLGARTLSARAILVADESQRRSRITPTTTRAAPIQRLGVGVSPSRMTPSRKTTTGTTWEASPARKA